MPRRPGHKPLPVRDGLNPSRVRTPLAITARDFLTHLIATQRHRHPADDAAAVDARFTRGEVVDGRGCPLRPDDELAPGTDVWFYRMPAPERRVPYDIRVLYADERIVVIDKPPFLATMPRAQHITETATVRLRRQLGNDELSPAHRLDRLTSGLLLFTTQQRYRGAYQNLFAHRQVTKTYQAIAAYDATLADTAPLTWRHHMVKQPGHYQAHLTDGEPNAMTTLQEVTRLSNAEAASLRARYDTQGELGRYVLRPLTGRTHQLRLHMCCAGVPILGDTAYPVALPADEEDFAAPLQLTATTLEFTDPISHERRAFWL